METKIIIFLFFILQIKSSFTMNYAPVLTSVHENSVLPDDILLGEIFLAHFELYGDNDCSFFDKPIYYHFSYYGIYLPIFVCDLRSHIERTSAEGIKRPQNSIHPMNGNLWLNLNSEYTYTNACFLFDDFFQQVKDYHKCLYISVQCPYYKISFKLIMESLIHGFIKYCHENNYHPLAKYQDYIRRVQIVEEVDLSKCGNVPPPLVGV